MASFYIEGYAFPIEISAFPIEESSFYNTAQKLTCYITYQGDAEGPSQEGLGTHLDKRHILTNAPF